MKGGSKTKGSFHTIIECWKEFSSCFTFLNHSPRYERGDRHGRWEDIGSARNN